jgi:hypothetical protein
MTRILQRALCLAALTLSCTANADGVYQMVLNGKSIHINSKYDWNESNYGIGLEYQFAGDSRWIKVAMANAFRDSLNNTTYLAGAGIHRRLFMTDRLSGLYVDAGLNGFLMAREDINEGQPFAGILPSITLGNQYGGINIAYIPRRAVHDIAHADVVDPTIQGIVFLQLKVRLDRFFRN